MAKTRRDHSGPRGSRERPARLTAVLALAGLVGAVDVSYAPTAAAEAQAPLESGPLSPTAGSHPGAEMPVGEPTAFSAAPGLVTTESDETATAGSGEGPSVIAAETIGGLSIGAKASAAERLLGPPKTRTKPKLWGADGLYHSDWRYPAAGVLVGTSAPERSGPWEVFSVALKSPAKLKSARGIGIGSTRQELMATYRRDAHQDPSGSVLVGNEYDGLMFQFDRHDRVAEIFLGALAE